MATVADFEKDSCKLGSYFVSGFLQYLIDSFKEKGENKTTFLR